MLTITSKSHLDHGLTTDHIHLILTKFGDRTSFFVETIELPSELESLWCGLYGPIMGDAPVADEDTLMYPRPGREYPSRLYVNQRRVEELGRIDADTVPVLVRPLRTTRKLTVIAGPFEGTVKHTKSGEQHMGESLSCMLYTAFGGPAAPKELGDPSLTKQEFEASLAFWNEHALVF